MLNVLYTDSVYSKPYLFCSLARFISTWHRFSLWLSGKPLMMVINIWNRKSNYHSKASRMGIKWITGVSERASKRSISWFVYLFNCCFNPKIFHLLQPAIWWNESGQRLQKTHPHPLFGGNLTKYGQQGKKASMRCSNKLTTLPWRPQLILSVQNKNSGHFRNNYR